MPKTEDQEEQNEHQHIPTESLETQVKEAGLNTGSQGLLSQVGDPVGNTLGTVLRPLGAALESAVTGPLGDLLGGATRGTLGPFLGKREERLEILGGENKENKKQDQENSDGYEVHMLLRNWEVENRQHKIRWA